MDIGIEEECEKGNDVGKQEHGGKRGTAFVLVKEPKKSTILSPSLGVTPLGLLP
jgi:hypothetical protein